MYATNRMNEIYLKEKKWLIIILADRVLCVVEGGYTKLQIL